jgi:hypothetical protein
MIHSLSKILEGTKENLLDICFLHVLIVVLYEAVAMDSRK